MGKLNSPTRKSSSNTHPGTSSSSDSSDSETESPSSPSTPNSASSKSPNPPPTPTSALKTSEITAHRKEMEDAQLRLESAKEGDWLIHVHVLESRELRATDPDGTADPVCVVEVNFGDGKKKKASTRVVQNDRNAVFDEMFKFEFSGLTRPDIEMGQVSISVIDSDATVGGHGVGEFIGAWTADILDSIYSRPDHEFYRHFVSLENDEATNKDESGTQGFLKVSVVATGPGDKMKIHNVEKERAAERKEQASGEIVSLPIMTPVELRFLVVKIHSLDNLMVPAGNCYVKIEFGTASFDTLPLLTSPNPHTPTQFLTRYSNINQSIWLAVLHPTMTQSIRISIWEKRGVVMTSSKLIAMCRILKLSRVRAYPKKFKKTQLPFYGAPSHLYGSSSKEVKIMNTQSDCASCYRGRLTISLEEKPGHKKDGTQRPQENKVKPIKPLSPRNLAQYTFKAFIISGANLPKTKSSSMIKNLYSVQVSVASAFIATKALKPTKTNMVDFSKAGVISRTFQASPDPIQVPDLIITLLKGPEGKATPIAYRRFSTVNLLENKTFEPIQDTPDTHRLDVGEPSATWVHLKEDKAVDAIHDAVFPGSLLVKIGLYEGSKPDEWSSETVLPDVTVGGSKTPLINAKVKVHLLKGRDLPPWDQDTGALDGYVKITVGTTTLISSVKNDTRNPAWYETMVFDTTLPRDKDKRPEIIMQVWDRDEGIGESDDFVGNAILRLDEDDGKAPFWNKLFYQEPGDIKCGEVLAGIEVVEEDAVNMEDAMEESESSSTPTPSNDESVNTAKVVKMPRGKGRTGSVEIIALGCRSLKATSSFQSIKKPFISCRIGDSVECKTKPSNRPRPEFCNYSETLLFENVDLPDDDDQAPFLDIKVFDKGTIAGKTLLGTGSFWLGNSAYYREIRNKRSQTLARSGRGGSRGGSEEIDIWSNEDYDNESDDEKGLDWVSQAPYMKGRQVVMAEMKCKPVFSVVKLFRGKKMSDKSKSETQKYELEEIGRFHLFARVILSDGSAKLDVRTQRIVNAMKDKQKFRVRLYALEAMDLTAKDGKTSDPFLRVRLANAKYDTEKQLKRLHPEFYERFDMTCKIPGDTMLHVEVWDWDRFGSNDLIGSAVIDLESRWFSNNWHEHELKPVEHISLMHPSSSQQQGQLQLWLDMVPTKSEKTLEKWDITPPPPADFEMRCVIWKAEEIPAGDEFSDQSDLYVKLRLGEQEWKSTDVHYFAKGGKGSWNFRIKFPLSLRQGGRVVWDMDLLVSDCLAETSMDLSDAFKTAFNTRDLGMEYSVFGESSRQLKEAVARKKLQGEESEGKWTLKSGEVGRGGEKGKKKKQGQKKKKKSMMEQLRGSLGLTAPENSGWVSFGKTDLKTGKVESRGKLLVSVEILPIDLVNRRKCGDGREEPNAFPMLPPPEGRVDFTKMMFNPFYAVQTCLGDSLAKECGAGCCCILFAVAFVAFGVVFGPEIQILMSVLSMLPVAVAKIVVGVIAGLIFLCCGYLCCCVCKKDKVPDDDEYDEIV
ncbi:hypothetical protein TL16_g03481 [Triparma laevis f. inornata]|uniref:C2 domain-containing protein n=1 Tax=Triparma laevis f. inornata TaxID=1714386 RepID=A0A9W7A1R3_9STRA|nr:hypothetical protein TL16_g03481 [Triparma laevis f. inornata]